MRRNVWSQYAGTLGEEQAGQMAPEKVRDFVRKRVTDIPGHLVIIASTDADRRKSDMNYAAVCGIMQNFQLLAWQRRLGTLWDTEPMMQSKELFDLLKLHPMRDWLVFFIWVISIRLQEAEHEHKQKRNGRY